MASYRLSQKAKRDLESIANYTAEAFGSRQAHIYISQLMRAVEIAAAFPAAGRSYQTSDGRTFRQYLSGRHVFFYQQAEDRIEITRFLHQMMEF